MPGYVSRSQLMPPRFAEKITEVQELLDQYAIPHRMLGSVAAFGHVHAATDWRLNFDRSKLLPRHQRVPDLDILVRRCDLPVAQQLSRQVLRDSLYPVNLELLSAQCHFDWLPDEELSYIFHRDLRVPFSSALFGLVQVEVDGIAMNTISARSLLHIYVTMGATLRNKDCKPVRALAGLCGVPSCGPDYRSFHQFIRLQQQQYRGYVLSRVVGEKLRTTMPAAPFYWLTNAGKKLQPLLFGAGSGV